MSTLSVQTAQSIRALFDAQQGYRPVVASSTTNERIAKLKKLKASVLAHRQEIRDALREDFKKHSSEVDLTEIYPVTSEIKHTIKHLRKWMRPKGVGTPLALLGTRSWVHYEPKGVCLIISPWNFPVNLSFSPLVAAVAAGNCVILKPSENTPNASAIMAKIIEDVFDPREVVVVQGAVEASTELLKLPFNHIFFTGAPSIGKIVMRAAAENLASVTLELGGKSPTIVHDDANIKKAAKRIAWAKYSNNGQVCIAPDYLFIHSSVHDEFIDEFKRCVNEFYGEKPDQAEAYCRIVNERHHARISSYIDDAVSRGAKALYGGNHGSTDNYIAPTILSNVTREMEVMKNEIFGPVLPVMTYNDLSEVIGFINGGEKPLALYIYSKSQKVADEIIANTSAGGTVINHSILHYSNANLPFGGVNNSGIGKANGEWGFKAFSNERAVLKQWSPASAIDSLMPPYTDAKQKLIDLTIKYF